MLGRSERGRLAVVPETLSTEERGLIDQAIGVVCSERRLDALGSVPIDDMQRRPSLSLHAPEVVKGAERAQRLLPNAKVLAIAALRQLSKAYQVDRYSRHTAHMNRAVARIQAVVRIKPDMDARDSFGA